MNSGFSVVEREGIQLISVDCINDTKCFSAFYSTGNNGCSQMPGNCTMNLSIFKKNDLQASIEKNFEQFASAAGISGGYQSMIAQHEMHTPTIKRVTKQDIREDFFDPDLYEPADGQVTNDDVALFVYASDCATILLADPESGLFATTHCGWKNSLNSTIHNWICLFNEMGGNKKTAIAAIGPSICQNCFEVDDDVREAFLAYNSDFEQYMFKRGVKTHIDLPSINRQLLISEGISPNNVYLSGICNVEDFNLPSYRRDKGKNGIYGGVLFRI